MLWNDIHTGGRGRRVKAFVRFKQQILAQLASTNMSAVRPRAFVKEECHHSPASIRQMSLPTAFRARSSALSSFSQRSRICSNWRSWTSKVWQQSIHLVGHVLVLGVHPQKLLLEVEKLIFQFALSAPQLYQSEQRAVFNQGRRFKFSWLTFIGQLS